ncbi:IS66 family insertion sequence element accessory protein TnpB [uncultured Jannaschia sp.]|uniref:IS66 family insertion sequence element accessory protein TnpB n=1 Tax=uncultured Jannaschia sp. TaxID=293347 RepID=UPI00262B3D48|nr:IS66 family insertion sequence element accessory protein TnpB [uncultured Jannaschia sp.]
MSKRRKRRIWSDDENWVICGQTRVPGVCGQTRVLGVSVGQVARRYDVNANLVFTWLRDPRFAVASASTDEAVVEPSDFLPVQIIDRPESEGPASTPALGTIEIDVAGGHRLRVVGAYDSEALARLIRGLSP